MNLPKSVLKNYKKGTACIRYKLNGRIRILYLTESYLADYYYKIDTEQALRMHLKKWMPDAKFK